MDLESTFKSLHKLVNEKKIGETNTLFTNFLAHSKKEITPELNEYFIILDNAKKTLDYDKIIGEDRKVYANLINDAATSLDKIYEVVNQAFTLYNLVTGLDNHDADDMKRVHNLITDAAAYNKHVMKAITEIKNINKKYGINDARK